MLRSSQRRYDAGLPPDIHRCLTCTPFAQATTAEPAQQKGDAGIATEGGGGSGRAGGGSVVRRTFAELPLSARTVRALKEAKFTRMTQIQRAALPQ